MAVLETTFRRMGSRPGSFQNIPQSEKQALQSDSEPDIPMPRKLKQYFESRQSSKDRNKPGKNKEDSQFASATG